MFSVLSCLFYTLSAFLLLGSVYYEKLSRSDELFYLHNLHKGSLSIESTFTKEYLNHVRLVCNPFQFQLSCGNKEVFKKILSENQNQGNFLTLLKSEPEIEGHGDAFYQIKDHPQFLCQKQRILNVFEDKNKTLIIEGDFADCLSSQYQIRLRNDQTNNDILIQVKLLNEEQIYNRIWLKFADHKDSEYFGLGEQFSHLNLKRNTPYSMLVREKGAGRSDHPETALLNFAYKIGGSYYASHCPTPIWLSSDKLGYALNSFTYSVWMNNGILVWDNSFNITVMTGNSIKEIVGKIANINGYTPPVPSWVNEGAIIGLQGGTEQVLQKYKKVKENGVKVSGVWMQDWVSKRQSMGYSRLWWNWELDHQHYSNWTTLAQFFKNQTVKTLIYINPMLSNISTKTNYRQHFYEQAVKNDYFVKNKENQLYHISAFSDYLSAFIDFYKPEAKDFFKKMLRAALEETGASGMMIDFAEGYPISDSSLPLIEAIKAHNNYPNKYIEAVSQVFKEFSDRHMFGFIRAGFLGTAHKEMHLWAADQSITFKKNTGLPSCLSAMLSSSLVGYSTTHCDIGGYVYYDAPLMLVDSVRTPILMSRWLQLAAFSPVFRSHEGNRPEKLMQSFHNELVHQFAFYSQVFSLLANYRKQQSQKSWQSKIPLIRPMFLEAEEPKEIFDIQDQFFLGSDILVCPILTPKNKRRFFLPKGKWINIWNQEENQGCDCYKQSTSFFPPVLIKDNSNWKEEIIQGIQELTQRFTQIYMGDRNEEEL